MSYGEEQKKEIATIKERTIKLQLSDADCDRIAEKAGKAGLTVAELLQNFIGDLVGGTYSNGSDERDYADRWFDRCWFGMFPENTLLRHLLEWGYDVDDFVSAWEEKKYAEEHPEEFEEERADFVEGERFWFEEEVEYGMEDWKSDGELDMEKEVEICRKWLAEVQALKETGKEK